MAMKAAMPMIHSGIAINAVKYPTEKCHLKWITAMSKSKGAAYVVLDQMKDPGIRVISSCSTPPSGRYIPSTSLPGKQRAIWE